MRYRLKPGKVVSRTLLYLLVIGLAFVFALPMIWLVSSSLKPEKELFNYPPSLIPSRLEFGNYPFALKQFAWVRGLANTMIVVVMTMVGGILTASMAAYAFARLRFPFKGPLFIIVLSTMMIPGFVLILPQYIIFRNLHWLDTLRPLTIPAWFGGGAFSIFLLRQFFMTIPREYDDGRASMAAG